MAPTGDGKEPEAIALARVALATGETAFAAGDATEAIRWFERAHRLVPRDHNVALKLATASLAQDDAQAEALFSVVADADDLREAWLGLAAARLRLGHAASAATALGEALSRHAPAPFIAAVANPVVSAAGLPGWCGLAGDGTLTIGAADPASVEARLDGRAVRAGRLPTSWRTARRLSVTIGGRHLVGSPIDVGALRRIEGCVEACEGGLRGWAWYPGDPDTDPVLRIQGPLHRRPLLVTASDLTGTIEDSGPLARQRLFHIPAAVLRAMPGLLHVRGSDGRDLLGSPLDPCTEQRATAAAAAAMAQLYPSGKPRQQRLAAVAAPAMPADVVGPSPPDGADGRRRIADVVIPVFGNAAMALGCLDSVLATVKPPSRVIVVDDASPETELVRALQALAASKRIRLIRHATNQGFPASANTGIAACPGRDVVLLNSDTLVPDGWLQRLQAAARSAPDIGTVTPLSNNATILSYPGRGGDDRRRDGDDHMPDRAETKRLDRLTHRANRDGLLEIPVGIGFCLYIRRDCLDAVGLLRADVFAQGYGEENDFCLRARHLGWRHMALTGLFVAHGSGKSFGAAGLHLRTRNEKLLDRLHPGYADLIARFTAADPLAGVRRNLDLERWRAARRRGGGAAILITHNDGGGVEQRVAASVAAHRAAGRRAILLRPATMGDGGHGVAVGDGVDTDYPDLRFAVPADLSALLRLLRDERPDMIEVHHFLEHSPLIYQLISRLGLPYEVHIHDYPWFCQRVSLVGGQSRYCGEPEPPVCEACIADTGRVMAEEISVASMLDRSARFLAAARRVVAPSEDAAQRMRRHFPTLRPIVIPHDDDDAIAEPAPPQAQDGRCRVCVVGAIGVHKGYDVLLACARDAAGRTLDLEFIVVGTTIDDSRLMATGRVFVTGRYKPHEVVALIRRQRASLALLPSIWPETWCLGLSEIWRAGLQAAAFDIGAPAERIRRTGRGFVLPPNLPPAAVNNALVASVGLSRHERK